MNVTTCRAFLATAVVCLWTLAPVAALAALPPAVITSTGYDTTNQQLTVQGSSLIRGTTLPAVTFDGVPLPVLSATSSTVVASLPNTFAPGTYIVTLARGSGLGNFAFFPVTLGAIGPQGERGPQGDVGPVGPAGADGAQGPAGPNGPTGATGGTGLQGPQGPRGLQGLPGSPGPQGVPGPAGTGGAVFTTVAPGPKLFTNYRCSTPFGITGLPTCPRATEAMTPVASLDLPAGEYVVLATIQLKNQATFFLENNGRVVNCALYRGPYDPFNVIRQSSEYLDGIDSNRWYAQMHFNAAERFAVAATVSVGCTGSNEDHGPVWITEATLTAIRAGSITDQ